MLPLTSAARRWLLGLARSSLEAVGRGEPIPPSSPPSEFSDSDREALNHPRAVFVSLHRRGMLRGCVGHLRCDTPLARLVAEMTLAAARQDARFSPVAPEEIPDIELEISVLSPFVPVQPEQVIPGIHGLLVRRGSHRGLLLPQVAASRQWDCLTFVGEACRKAGLAPDAWKHGAQVEAFTAEIMAEHNLVGEPRP